jgi:DNA-directed RNA polymerase specialized sigma24 family protein
MVNMTPKEFLEEYRKAGRRIVRITAELEELRAQAELPGFGLSGVAVKITPRNRMDEVIPALVDGTTDLDAELRDARRIRRQVKKAIAAVRDDRYREVLAYIYICGFTLEQVSELIDRDIKTVKRRRNAAFEHIRVPKNIF